MSWCLEVQQQLVIDSQEPEGWDSTQDQLATSDLLSLLVGLVGGAKAPQPTFCTVLFQTQANLCLLSYQEPPDQIGVISVVGDLRSLSY